jgi:hypothetical protein
MYAALVRTDEVDAGRPTPLPRGASLERLRALAVRCRAARRLDLLRACQMLSGDTGEAGTAFAAALIRTLSQGLGRPPVFFKPGSREVSFDERWLIALVAAVQKPDESSFEFLIRSRLARHTHRPTAFLARNLAMRLDTL